MWLILEAYREEILLVHPEHHDDRDDGEEDEEN
jgi:hypothetical protein